MNNKTFEEINVIGQASYEASKKLAEINTKVLEEICEQQLALANLLVENLTTQMRLIGCAKDFKEVLSGQTEISADIGGKVVGIARNTADIMNEYKERCSSWYYEQGARRPISGSVC